MNANRNTPNLALHHIEAIIAVASAGTLTRAAERLLLTPSAIHHRIADAERRLDVKLFEKTGRRLIPSPAGEMIVKHGQRLLSDLANLETDVERLQSEHHQVIRIAMAFYSVFDWFADFHSQWQDSKPEIDLQVVADCRRHSEAHLLDGEIDICLFPYRPSHQELIATRLFDDDLVLIASPDHPLANHETIAAKDLSDQHFYTFTRVVVPDHEYERFLRPGNVRPRRWIDLDLPELIAAVVAKGDGVSILSRWSLRHWLVGGSLVALPLEDGGLPITWYAVHRRNHDKQKLIDEFIQSLEGYFSGQ